MSTNLGLIIEAEALNRYLETDKEGAAELLIIDLSSPQNYAEGHVPGAVQVLPQEIIAGSPPAPGKLPSADQLSQLFSRLGLTPTTHVVVYDDEGGGWAGRFIWTLDVIGHHRYSYLNGGLWAWRAAQLPLSRQSHHPLPTKVAVTIHHEPITNKEDIIAAIGRDDFVIWDARGLDEYQGRRQSAKKNGHIPGAIHCEWTELMDKTADLRIRKDAEQYLQNMGFNRNQTIVTHCQTHHRSGLTYLVGKSLGFNISAYPGSWSEWGNSAETPVEA